MPTADKDQTDKPQEAEAKIEELMTGRNRIEFWSRGDEDSSHEDSSLTPRRA